VVFHCHGCLFTFLATLIDCFLFWEKATLSFVMDHCPCIKFSSFHTTPQKPKHPHCMQCNGMKHNGLAQCAMPWHNVQHTMVLAMTPNAATNATATKQPNNATRAHVIATTQVDCCVYFLFCCHFLLSLFDSNNSSGCQFAAPASNAVPGPVFFPNIFYTLQRSFWVRCRGEVQTF